MKTLELILRLLDEVLTAIKFRKAQNERNELAENPANWFATHFGYGVQSDKPKTDKTAPTSNSSE